MTNKWKTITLINFLTALLMVIGTTIIVSSQEQNVTAKRKVQVKEKQQDDPPTLIQLGVMSEKQKKNSKRFNRSPEVASLISEDRDILRGIGESLITEEISGESLSLETYYQKPICQADAVFVGKVKDKNSQLSEDNKSIFTDYEVEILDVIKNASASNLQLGSTVTVTRSGGVVKLNNRRIEVVNAAFPRLKIGNQYLLFVNYLNESDSFEPSSTSEGTIEIRDNKIKRLRRQIAPYQTNNDEVASFLGSLRNLVQQCLPQGGQ